MAYFSVQLLLKTAKWQEDIIDKRFRIACQVYNTAVTKLNKRCAEMVKTKKYRGLMESLTGDKKADKETWKEINKIRQDNGFTQFGIIDFVGKLLKPYKDNLNSNFRSSIANRLWRSYDAYFYGTGCKVGYCRLDNWNSLAGKHGSGNKARGIEFNFATEEISWLGLTIKAKVKHDDYINQAFQNELRYCTVVRKFVRNKYKYYVQLLFSGVVPTKHNADGTLKHPRGIGNIGLNIGTDTLAVVTDFSSKLYNLRGMSPDFEVKEAELLRRMERSRRAMNPDNYNADGTIKHCKLHWVRSKKYIACQMKLKELYRKQSAVRKYNYECLANDIIALGNNIYVNKVSFDDLSRRLVDIENTDAEPKKQLGKPIQQNAPSLLIEIIKRKLGYYDGTITEVELNKPQMTGVNLVEYEERGISNRYIEVDGCKLQSDLYFAYLLNNMQSDLKAVDTDKYNKQFDNFKVMHDIAVLAI